MTTLAGTVVRVAAHCGACAQTVEFTGSIAKSMAAAWADCHYQPVIDEFDVGTVHGTTETWRHTS